MGRRGCEPSTTEVTRSRTAVGTHHGRALTVGQTLLPAPHPRPHTALNRPRFIGTYTEGLSSPPVKNSYSHFKARRASLPWSPGRGPSPSPASLGIHRSRLLVCAHPLSPLLKGLVFGVNPWCTPASGGDKGSRRVCQMGQRRLWPLFLLPRGLLQEKPAGLPPRGPGGLQGPGSSEGPLGWLLPWLILPGSWGRGSRRGVPALRDGCGCRRRGHRARGRGAP